MKMTRHDVSKQFLFLGVLLLLSCGSGFSKAKPDAESAEEDDTEVVVVGDERDPDMEAQVDQKKMPKDLCFTLNLILVTSDGTSREEKGPEVCTDVSAIFQKKDVRCSKDVFPCEGSAQCNLQFTSEGYSFNTTGSTSYVIFPYDEQRLRGQLELFTNWEYRLSNILSAFKEQVGLSLESIILPGNTDFHVDYEFIWQDESPEPKVSIKRVYAIGFDANNKEYDVIIEPVVSKLTYQQ